MGGSYYGFEKCIPYAGFQFLKIDGNADIVHHYNGATLVDHHEGFNETDSLGLFVGADIPLSQRTNLFIEGHLIHETGISLGLIVSF